MKKSNLQTRPPLDNARDGSSRSRPPVVTVMGHVDHGKTSLLSAIKDQDLTRKEFGGISQHIGAYQVKGITFIDTPGHAAFTQMRVRGAEVTDIVVLVVAADEGVKPQTKEALGHARAAEVPIIVAINKIDLPNANIERTKKDLVEVGLVPEDLGGDTIVVEVSAKTKKGLDQLLEMILLVAEMEELQADPQAPFEGVVIESELDSRRGPVATILVKNGTLKTGDEIFSGQTSGKVKAMIDDRGQRVKEAGPSTPAEILGLDEVPAVGSTISSSSVPAAVPSVPKPPEPDRDVDINGEAIDKTEGIRILNIVLKSDVEGTLEAIRAAVQKLEPARNASPSEAGRPQIKFIHAATGEINESDVLLAQASDALIFGFNVKISNDIKHLAKISGVEVRTYNIIYELLEGAEKALQGILEKQEEKDVRAEGEIIKLFTLPKSGEVIAGTRLDYGQVKAGDKINVIRDGEVNHSGKVKSLSIESKEKKRASSGAEVGILIKPQFKFKVGDTLVVP